MKTGGVWLGLAVGAAGLIAVFGRPNADTDSAKTASSSAEHSPPEPAAPSAADPGPSLNGQVKEAIDVAQYTYLRLSTAQGEVWAAVSKAAVAVGSQVAIVNASRMDHFESPTLKRTFDVIYFGNLGGANSGSAANSDLPPEVPELDPDSDDNSLPPGHPPIGAAPGAAEHGAVAAAAPAAPLPSVEVKPATGKNAKTIAALYAEGPKLEGKPVRVRGQVVKATLDVQGKNYFRLRDESGGSPEHRELVVASSASANRGDVVTFEGTVRTNVDLGIGFTYPVLVEDAQLAPP